VLRISGSRLAATIGGLAARAMRAIYVEGRVFQVTGGRDRERVAEQALIRAVDRDRRVTRPARKSGYSTPQLATDLASLVTHLDVGPAHVVGTSTGGAIAQMMALDHADTVRSITLASAFGEA
jgi:pimeloyl-ACP methyl ester carboxylesterase